MLEQFGNIMEKAKKIRLNISSVQEQLKNERIEVSSGDVIKIVVNRQQSLLSPEINSKYFDPNNVALLQHLLVVTVNNALEKSRDLQQTAMNKVSEDLNLPKIPSLF